MRLPISRGPRLRPVTPQDARACHAVFRDAVMTGAKKLYPPAQRAAWAGPQAMPDDWPDRLLAHDTWVATRGLGRIEGFVTLSAKAHIDFLYVLPAQMGRGTAARLYDQAETCARDAGTQMMTTEASHLARSFFTRQGWQIEGRQSVIRDSVAITNYRMFKVF